MRAKLSSELTKVVDAKAGGVQSTRIAWERAVESGISAGGSDAILVRLVALFRTPSQLQALARQVGKDGGCLDEEMSVLLESVDELPFSVEDWFRAFERVQGLLIKESRMVAPRVIAGYLHCCVEFAAGNEAGLSLDELVAEMLDKYGFDG